MQLTYDCSRCESVNRAASIETAARVTCRQCGDAIELRAGAVAADRLLRCAVCGTEELYIQKDFPQRIGMSILGAGVLLSTLAWWQYRYLAALGVLVATAAIDCILYYLVPDVVVCYRCGAQYRGAARRPEIEPFDLAVGERFRQERLRLDELRRREQRAVPPTNEGPRPDPLPKGEE